MATQASKATLQLAQLLLDREPPLQHATTEDLQADAWLWMAYGVHRMADTAAQLAHELHLMRIG